MFNRLHDAARALNDDKLSRLVDRLIELDFLSRQLGLGPLGFHDDWERLEKASAIVIKVVERDAKLKASSGLDDVGNKERNQNRKTAEPIADVGEVINHAPLTEAESDTQSLFDARAEFEAALEAAEFNMGKSIAWSYVKIKI